MIITNLFNRDCRGCCIQSHDAPERMLQRHRMEDAVIYETSLAVQTVVLHQLYSLDDSLA